MSTKNLIVISDTHCGDQMGLCPPRIMLRHGGVYESSRFQDAVRECWDKWPSALMRSPMNWATGAATRHIYRWAGACLVHATHHIGVTGSMAYETTALTKEFNEFCAESARWGRPIPDVVIRSHRHRHIEVRVPTGRGYGIIFVTPAWQLKTPYLFRVPGGRVTTPMIGGSLIRQGDEEWFTRHMIWETQRQRTEVV